MQKTKRLFVLMLSMTLPALQVSQRVIGQTRNLVFNYNVIEGSESSELHLVLNNVTIQRLLLDIGIKPRKQAYLDSVLQGTNFTSETLRDLDFVRYQGGIYTINFLLFNRADEVKMREITESHARMLAEALLNRRPDIEAIIKDYQLPSVDPRAALYIILGCFSLDWDGLALTAERGYRSSPSLFHRLFPRTTVYAWEPSDLTRRGFYKGSHNTSYDDATLTSFGDHEIQPRRAFPDVLWSRDHYPDSLKLRLKEIIETTSEKIVGRQVACLMLALRDGNKSLPELAKVVDASEQNVRKLADLLVEFRYLSHDAGQYSARIPVLTLRDSSIIRRIRQIGREEMEHWFKHGYQQLHDQLAELSPFRYGVDQSIFFYYIWHDVFGATNRILVESGLFADPYSEFYGSRGLIPVVFESSLCEEP